MHEQLHPLTPHHLPFYIAKPGETDVWMIVMGIFTVYTGVILMHFFPYVPCSCGGVIKRLTWTQHLILNLSFVAISILGVILQHKKRFNTIPVTKSNKNSFV